MCFDPYGKGVSVSQAGRARVCFIATIRDNMSLIHHLRRLMIACMHPSRPRLSGESDTDTAQRFGLFVFTRTSVRSQRGAGHILCTGLEDRDRGRASAIDPQRQC